MTPVYNDKQKEAWNLIWGWKEVIPKIKMFLWRGIHGGLATAFDLHRRISAIDPMCQRCTTENEFLAHILFFCPLSRATWFASEFQIRADHIPLDFTEALIMITSPMYRQQVVRFCNILWCVWKARNEELFQAIKTIPRIILKQADLLQLPTTEGTQGQNNHGHDQGYTVPDNTAVVLIDASWDMTNRGGWGALLFDSNGNLHCATVQPLMVSDPFHSEAAAMHGVLQWHRLSEWVGQGKQVRIYSDCKTLVNLVSDYPAIELPTWQAAEEVAECIKLLAPWRRWVSIWHAGRTALLTPHRMANWARTNRRRMMGIENVRQECGIMLETELDRNFFAIGTCNGLSVL